MGELKKMNVHEKLLVVQSEIKVKKTKYNKFGEYYYRNLDDIFNALKPVLKKENAVIVLNDEPVVIGDFNYMKVTATFTNVDDGESVESIGYARIEPNKPKMSQEQVTASASSFSRKIALNGLLLLDDMKDVDSANNSNQPKKPTSTKPKSSKARDEVLKYIKENNLIMADIAKEFGLSKDTTDEIYTSTLEALKARA